MSIPTPNYVPDEKRLELQSMPEHIMRLAKDQFGSHFILFEVWVGEVIDKAFDIGKAAASPETGTTFSDWYKKRWGDESGRLFTRQDLKEAFYVAAPSAKKPIDPVQVALDVARDVAELGGRDSPDDQPDMMLVRDSELRHIVHDRLMEALLAAR